MSTILVNAMTGAAIGIIFFVTIAIIGLLIFRIFSEKNKSAKVGHFQVRARVVTFRENGEMRQQCIYFVNTPGDGGVPIFATRPNMGNLYTSYSNAVAAADSLVPDFTDRFGNTTAIIEVVEKHHYPIMGETWEVVAKR